MKKIYKQLVIFIKNDVKLLYVLWLFLFVGGIIFTSYYLNFYNILISYRRKGIYPFLIFVFYGITYLYALIGYAFLYKKWDIFVQKKLYFAMIAVLLSITLNRSVYVDQVLVEKNVPYPFMAYVFRITTQFSGIIYYFVPLYIYWYIFDRKKHPLYGFHYQKNVWKTYILLLICMIPLLAAASFTSSFLRMYPLYKDYGFSEAVNIPEWVSVSVFEFLYASGFVMVEFVFRGFLILAMQEVLGIHGVLPMATIYCVFHMGKPLVEFISSFFGGTLLGVVTYHSKSIYGGIFVHIGIALLMELFAFLQKTYLHLIQ
ncbi:MAG: CPBP family intramembrane metalloprotease [Chitinophagaceae bacterium]|nr:CPBP family intramembrane metalloprotease [Chitinophagaceae bacterium]